MSPVSSWHTYPPACQAAWNEAVGRLYEYGYAPIRCPCCQEGVLRIYWNAHFHDLLPDGQTRRRGGGWMWCPACHSCDHWSGLVPAWWPAERIVPERELLGTPQGIDERWAEILQLIAP